MRQQTTAYHQPQVANKKKRRHLMTAFPGLIENDLLLTSTFQYDLFLARNMTTDQLILWQSFLSIFILICASISDSISSIQYAFVYNMVQFVLECSPKWCKINNNLKLKTMRTAISSIIIIATSYKYYAAFVRYGIHLNF